MATTALSIELQRKVLSIPRYKRFFRVRGGYSDGTSSVSCLDCVNQEGLTSLPEDILADFSPDIKDGNRLRIRLITDTQSVSNFQLSPVLVNFEQRKMLELETIAKIDYLNEIAQQQRKYDEKRKLMNPQLPEREIDEQINTRWKMRGKYSIKDLQLAKQVRSVLREKHQPGKPLFDTSNLDTNYTENAPKGWPRDSDLPQCVSSILGIEYSRTAMENGVDLYRKEELETKVGNGRAWPVPILEGSILYFPDYQSIHSTLEYHIHNATGLPFILSKNSGYGGLGTYRHLHTVAAIALREQEPNVLYLEIYGSLIAVSGHDFTTREFEEYLTKKNYIEGKLFEPEGPLVVRIIKATLANLSYPGIGVPFYL